MWIADARRRVQSATMKQPLVFEVNARHWLADLSARNGRTTTLGKVPDEEIARWRDSGFTHVWLMGVWEVGPQAQAVAAADPGLQRAASDTLPGTDEPVLCGSPFAIAGYRVARTLGSETGLKKLRRQLHRHNLGLILDYVPNHVGLDHPWLDQCPDRFVQGVAGTPGTFIRSGPAGDRVYAHGRDPNFPVWPDTAQLEYRNPETRAAMIDELGLVAARCDGIRCDMAMLLMNEVFERTWRDFPREGTPPAREFWGEAIAQTKRQHPDCLFLAEVYWDLEATLQNLGFDYTYDKRLYDLLLARDPGAVQTHLLERPPGFVSRSAHFLENHDEVRIASRLDPAEHAAAAWLMLSLPGMRLLQDGQLTGARLRTRVQWARRPIEPAVDEIQSMYSRLLQATQSGAVGQNDGRVLAPRPAWPDNPTWRNIIVVFWPGGSREFDVSVVNLAPHRSQCYVPLPVTNLQQNNWRLEDRLGVEVYERFGDDLAQQGLYLDVAEHAAQLFRFEAL